MRFKNRFYPLVLAVLAFSAVLSINHKSRALAKGHEKGGGTIVQIDGKWLLADAFIGEISEFMELSPEMKKYLRWVMQKVEIQGLKSWPLEKQIFSENTVYLFVKELPCEDLTIIPGRVSQELACTESNITYILKDQFNKLDFHGKAMALIHERLHAFTKAEHILLMSFVDMLGTVARFASDQELEVRFKPTDKEIQAIRLLSQRGFQLGFEKNFDFNTALVRVWPNGGGRIILDHEARSFTISNDSYIDVNSRVEVKDDRFNKIISSTIKRSTLVLVNLINSKVIDSEVYVTSIEDSNLERVNESPHLSPFDSKNRHLQPSRFIRKSNLVSSVAHFSLENSNLNNCSLLYFLSFNTSLFNKIDSLACNDTKIDSVELMVGANAHLNNLKIDHAINEISFIPNSEISNLTIQGQLGGSGRYNFDFQPKAPMDFGGLNCFVESFYSYSYRVKKITIRSTQDLTKHCKKK